MLEHDINTKLQAKACQYQPSPVTSLSSSSSTLVEQSSNDLTLLLFFVVVVTVGETKSGGTAKYS